MIHRLNARESKIFLHAIICKEWKFKHNSVRFKIRNDINLKRIVTFLQKLFVSITLHQKVKFIRALKSENEKSC